MRTHRLFLIPLIVFFSWVAFFPSSLAQEKLPAIVKRIEPSTVVILTYDKKGETLAQGSGFFISRNGDVITNWHVLKGAARAEIKTEEGQVYPITRIVAEDREGDIIRASIDIPLKVVRPLSVSASIPKVGERVIVIGSPLGLEQTVADGIVSAVRDIPAFGNIIQITVPVSPGSSGSPVINMKGEVIGVATFQIVEGQNLNFVIPGERITKLTPGKGKSLAEWEAGRVKELRTSAEELYSQGFIFLWKEDYKKALPYFKKAVEKNPRYADAYFQIGYCNDNLGHYPEAIEAYKQAIRIQPDYAEAYNNLGVASFDLGRYPEAVEAYKQAIRIKLNYAEAYNNLGAAYSGLGRYSKAMEADKQAIRIKPDYAKAHYNLGAAYSGLGRYPEAIEAYKQAIRIQPDYVEAYNNLGVAYSGLGRYPEAMEAYKQAIRIQPDFANAHYVLGLTYLLLRDRGSALDEYKILKNLDKDLANKLFSLIYK